MENKQTAVEWLVEQIDPNLLVTEKVRLAVQQAKAMEKEQLVHAYNDTILNLRTKDGEQYYNETFKSE